MHHTIEQTVINDEVFGSVSGKMSRQSLKNAYL